MQHMANKHSNHASSLFKKCTHDDQIENRRWIKIGELYSLSRLVVVYSFGARHLKRLVENPPSDYLGEKKIFAKGPEVWQVGFVSPEKHCSEVFFDGLLFVFEILRMQTTLSLLEIYC